MASRYDTAKLREMTAQAEKANGIPAGFLHGLVEQESSWVPNPVARGIKKPNKNGTYDWGLTQINDINLKRFGVTGKQLEDNPQLALDIGAKILREETDRFGGNPLLGLAAYNAGAGSVSKWQKGGDLPKITRDYVPLVAARAQKYGATPMSQGDLTKIKSTFGTSLDENTISKRANILGKISPSDAVSTAYQLADVPQLPTSSFEEFKAQEVAQAPKETKPEDFKISIGDYNPTDFAMKLAKQETVAEPEKIDLFKVKNQLAEAFPQSDIETSDKMDKNVSTYLDGFFA